MTWSIEAELAKDSAPVQGSIVYSGRSFLFIAPEMRCLDVVRVVIRPRSAHSFGIPVVWNHILIVRELFMADGALAVLFDNLPIQQFPHFSW